MGSLVVSGHPTSFIPVSQFEWSDLWYVFDSCLFITYLHMIAVMLKLYKTISSTQKHQQALSSYFQLFPYMVASRKLFNEHPTPLMDSQWHNSRISSKRKQIRTDITVTQGMHEDLHESSTKTWCLMIFDGIWIRQHLWASWICNQAAFCGAAGAAAGALFGLVPCGRGFRDFSAKSAPPARFHPAYASPNSNQSTR